jgi:hypothetical protein
VTTLKHNTSLLAASDGCWCTFFFFVRSSCVSQALLKALRVRSSEPCQSHCSTAHDAGLNKIKPVAHGARKEKVARFGYTIKTSALLPTTHVLRATQWLDCGCSLKKYSPGLCPVLSCTTVPGRTPYRSGSGVHVHAHRDCTARVEQRRANELRTKDGREGRIKDGQRTSERRRAVGRVDGRTRTGDGRRRRTQLFLGSRGRNAFHFDLCDSHCHAVRSKVVINISKVSPPEVTKRNENLRL